MLSYRHRRASRSSPLVGGIVSLSTVKAEARLLLRP